MTSSVSPPQAHPTRAGRDLPAAIAVAVVLAVVIIASMVVVKAAFVGVVAVAILVALRELTVALSGADIQVPVVPVAAGSIGMLAGAYFGGATSLAVALAFTALAILAWRLPAGSEGYVRDVSAGVLCTVYLPLMGGFAVLLLRPEDGVWRVVTFIAVTAASDIGGYAVGALLGRHPMAPRISPKKSWEGFVGSMLSCVVTGSVLVMLALHGHWLTGVLLGVVIAAAATLGDLIESLIKRDLGIKDMGALLPGHGGLLDRLDSLVATVALSWLVLHLLVPVA